MSSQEEASVRTIGSVFGRTASTFSELENFVHFGERLVHHTSIAPGDRVLDVATGRGAVAFPAARRVGAGGRVIGTDISAEMLRETEKSLANDEWPMIELRQMSAETLTFPDSSFDCVTCGFALWFFPHPENALREFHRVIKPGRQLALTVIERASPWNHMVRDVLRPYSKERAEGNALSRFDTDDQLTTALRSAGFTKVCVEKEDFVSVVTEGAEWVWESLWSRGSRKVLEQLSEDELSAIRSAFLDRLLPLTKADGIHLAWRALIGVGVKPG